MGPITYSLCHKPVIGVLMYVSSLCAFPPPIPNEPLPMASAGLAVSKEFEAPVDKAYAFDLVFEFPTGDARLSDQILGKWPMEYCGKNIAYEDIPVTHRAVMGRPIPIRIVIRKISDRSIVADQTHVTLCSSGHTSTMKWRPIGWVNLTRGKYIAEVTNLKSQPGLEGVKTMFTLVGGRGK